MTTLDMCMYISGGKWGMLYSTGQTPMEENINA